ncbi:MAG: hypothetical protein ABI759_22325 [Candidatus Solibacter sp.]
MEQERSVAGEALVNAVLANIETAPLCEKDRALLRFVNRVNHDSPAITEADMQPLYAQGWDDAAIYYAITVCSLFNFYNRWIDASGVHPLSDEAHRMGSKRSAAMGYVRK